MAPSRRKVLSIFAGAVAPSFGSGLGLADTYPSRPVRIIVPLPAGSTSDIAARLIAQWLTERLGGPFIVENRPGAGTNIGTETVVRSKPDGYTLLSTGPSSAINASLYQNLNFNFLRDMVPIASFMRVPNVMEVHPSLPVHTVSEFIAYAKSRPGTINMASPGNGSTPHVAGELFKMMAGVDLVHVPYRAGALTDLIAGHVQVMFDTLPASIGQIRAGKVRALAVTSETPSPALPDVATIAATLPGYEASSWFGFSAPAGTPDKAIEKLAANINAAAADPSIQSRVAELGGEILARSQDDFRRLIVAETEKWAKVVQFSGAKPD